MYRTFNTLDEISDFATDAAFEEEETKASL